MGGRTNPLAREGARVAVRLFFDEVMCGSA
jgi:hypothetical protein